MPRQLSQAFREASRAPHTAATPIVLVSITHPSLGNEAVRMTSDFKHTVSRGETFVRLPFEMTLPDDMEDRPPRARITIANVSREIVRFIRELPPGEAPKVTFEVVLASNVNFVEENHGPFIMGEADYDEMNVSSELAIDDRSQEPYGAERYTPDTFLALFAAV